MGSDKMSLPFNLDVQKVGLFFLYRDLIIYDFEIQNILWPYWCLDWEICEIFGHQSGLSVPCFVIFWDFRSPIGLIGALFCKFVGFQFTNRAYWCPVL